MNREQRIEKVISGLVVTIDGPAGSGKSTTAFKVAERLGLNYLDTGAMYRAVTYAVLKKGLDPENGEEVSGLAGSMDLELKPAAGKLAFYLDGEDIEGEIRGAEVSKFVSPVSRHVGVRRAMVKLQRKIGASGGLVAEGRDTGSVVFPHAHVKVFLVANVEARITRRVKQLEEIGVEQSRDEIRENIVQRDAIDSKRSNSPLLRPPGSVLVDTSNLTIEEQVSAIEAVVRKEAERLTEMRLWPGEKSPASDMRLYYRISHAAVRAFFKILFGLKIFGEENLRLKGNFIFTSNHISYADPPVIGCALNREVWFMAKKELFRNRLFAWLIGTYHAIPVDREELDRKTMRSILDKLKRGESILMFPEGTRSQNGNIGSIKSGLGLISMHSGVDIVPVYVSGTNRLFSCFIRRERLRVHIGPPIRIPVEYVPENKKKDYQILSSMVLNEIRMLKDGFEA